MRDTHALENVYIRLREEKNSFHWNTGTEDWDTTASETRRFVWAGWLLLLELDGGNNVVRKYTWGLDLSGTLNSAGGIGGLLAVRQELIDRDPDPDVPANEHLYCHDAARYHRRDGVRRRDIA